MNVRTQQKGFTIIELVVVITLTAIVALLAGRNIARPIEGFIDLSRRAALVDEAQLALSRVSREVRLALPNSARITDGSSSLATCVATSGTSCSVEILRTLDGSRYRQELDSIGAGNILDISLAADSFDVLGNLQNQASIVAGASSLNDCLVGASDCLVINNLGFAGSNAYNGDNIAGVVSTSPFQFIRPTPFPADSSNQRFHVVDTPVTYVCNSAAGTLNRIDSYSISAVQLLTPAGTVARMSSNISSCIFRYSQGSSSRNAVLTVELTISQIKMNTGATESINLVEQIRVPNIP